MDKGVYSPHDYLQAVVNDTKRHHPDEQVNVQLPLRVAKDILKVWERRIEILREEREHNVTDERLAEIDALLAGITPGKWNYQETKDGTEAYIHNGDKTITGKMDVLDAAFIAAAPEIVRETIKKLKAETERADNAEAERDSLQARENELLDISVKLEQAKHTFERNDRA
jgi:DNA primase large subunit